MTQIVGLGGDCQVAYQIERFQPGCEKHFFDSLVCPIGSVIELIENGFDRVLQDSALAFKWEGDTLQQITDGHYNIWHLHHLGQGAVADITNLQQKYAYLAKKFMLLLESDEKIVFIRQWHAIDGTRSEVAARRLLVALQRINPAAELMFLHDRRTWEPFVDGPFRSVCLPPCPSDWRGDDEDWNRVFAALAFAEA